MGPSGRIAGNRASAPERGLVAAAWAESARLAESRVPNLGACNRHRGGRSCTSPRPVKDGERLLPERRTGRGVHLRDILHRLRKPDHRNEDGRDDGRDARVRSPAARSFLPSFRVHRFDLSRPPGGQLCARYQCRRVHVPAGGHRLGRRGDGCRPRIEDRSHGLGERRVRGESPLHGNHLHRAEFAGQVRADQRDVGVDRRAAVQLLSLVIEKEVVVGHGVPLASVWRVHGFPGRGRVGAILPHGVAKPRVRAPELGVYGADADTKPARHFLIRELVQPNEHEHAAHGFGHARDGPLHDRRELGGSEIPVGLRPGRRGARPFFVMQPFHGRSTSPRAPDVAQPIGNRAMHQRRERAVVVRIDLARGAALHQRTGHIVRDLERLVPGDVPRRVAHRTLHGLLVQPLGLDRYRSVAHPWLDWEWMIPLPIHTAQCQMVYTGSPAPVRHAASVSAPWPVANLGTPARLTSRARCPAVVPAPG